MEYSLTPLSRDGYPIKLTISKKVGNTIKRVNLKDSIPILPGSLRDLSKTFNTENRKGYFPHNFVAVIFFTCKKN